MGIGLLSRLFASRKFAALAESRSDSFDGSAVAFEISRARAFNGSLLDVSAPMTVRVTARHQGSANWLIISTRVPAGSLFIVLWARSANCACQDLIRWRESAVKVSVRSRHCAPKSVLSGSASARESTGHSRGSCNPASTSAYRLSTHPFRDES